MVVSVVHFAKVAYNVHSPGIVHKASVETKSCPKAMRDFKAGKPTVPKVSLLKSRVLLLTSHFPEWCVDVVVLSWDRYPASLGFTHELPTPLVVLSGSGPAVTARSSSISFLLLHIH